MRSFWNRYNLKWLTFFNPWILVHELGHFLVAHIFSIVYKDIKPTVMVKQGSVLGFDVIKCVMTFTGTKARINTIKSMGFVFEFGFAFFLLGKPLWLAVWLLVTLAHFASYFHTASPEYSDFNLVR